jgi:hypothetical protein
VAVGDGRSTGSGWSGFGFAVGDEPAGFVPAHGFVVTGGVDHRGTSTKSDRFRVMVVDMSRSFRGVARLVLVFGRMKRRPGVGFLFDWLAGLGVRLR